ncbi:MAG: glycosyltransferase family 4 protein [Clostridia bacterium]|nr:glycosyltransferase family 4 protein [Clostridia bacterium]
MKAVLMAPLPPPVGGIASWADSLLHREFPDGWTLLSVDEKILGPREVYGEGTRFRFWDEVRRTFGIWRNLWKTLSDKEAQVVHANTSATVPGMFREWVSASIAHLRGRKFLIEYHCTLPNEIRSRGKRFFFKRLSRKADGVIVLNKASADYARARTKKPVCLIPNFIESEYISEGRTVAPRVKKALYTGGVAEMKGCLDIIEAAKSFPEVEFILMGRVAPEVEAAEKPVNVTLTGVVERKRVLEALTEADLFLFCSRMSSEGFSVSLTEAMAAGLPCIVTDWAASADMVEGKGGIVIPISDVDALKAALAELIEDALRRQAMSDFCIRKVRENYTDTIILKQYAAAYTAAVTK